MLSDKPKSVKSAKSVRTVLAGPEVFGLSRFYRSYSLLPFSNVSKNVRKINLLLREAIKWDRLS